MWTLMRKQNSSWEQLIQHNQGEKFIKLWEHTKHADLSNK